MNPTLSRRRPGVRTLVLSIAAAVGATALFAPAAADAKPTNVKVMTRNIYLGADLTPALAAPTLPEAFTAAGNIYKQMQETNFRARAALIADEIQANKPHVIGLQEVALWRRGQRGAADGPATPAQEVVIDFLEVLRNEIAKRGLKYKVGRVQAQADIEIPADITGDGVPEWDGRLTMRDAILVRQNLRVKNRKSANFTAELPVPTGALGEINVKRGYTSVDITKGPKKNKRKQKTFRVINTHLEAFNAFIRNAQAAELRANPLTNGSRPTILLGDLNSDPDDDDIDPNPLPTPESAAYDTLIGDGFKDRGVTENTCCHDDDLLNDTVSFGSRIDHVLVMGKINRLGAKITGADLDLRTPTNLWPSDHAGVVSRLRVR